MPKGAGPFLGEESFPPQGGEARIIGVDPGLTGTGFGIIDIGTDGSLHYVHSGVIHPSAPTFPLRLQRIFQALSQQIKEHAPRRMAVERPFFAKNVKTAMLLGQARGVAILAGAEAGLEVEEYSPLEVKQAVVGYGRATKEQIQVMMQALLRTRQALQTDAADALAVALCQAHSLRWQTSLKKLGMDREGTCVGRLRPAAVPNRGRK